MTKFSKFQIATLKRVAQSVQPLVRVKTKLLKEIEERQAQLASIQIQIDAFQGPIKEMTGGYTTEDLVVREVTDTTNKQGNPVKVTSYKLKYPETIVPVESNVESTVEDTPEHTPIQVSAPSEEVFDAYMADNAASNDAAMAIQAQDTFDQSGIDII